MKQTFIPDYEMTSMTVMLPFFHISPPNFMAGGIEPPAHMRLLPRGEVWDFTGYINGSAMTDA